MKRKKSALSIIFGIFLAMGFIILTIGVAILISGIKFRDRAVEVPAVITDIQARMVGDEIEHSVWVEYEYNGKTYENIRMNEYNSGMYNGKEITILVDPGNPRKVSSKFGTFFVGAIFILIGTIFFCVGIVFILIKVRKASLQKKLIAGGRFLYAKVESIAQNTSFSMNGQHPYVVYCTYQDEYKNVVYRFKSGNIWENPEYVFQPGSDVRVYVNGNDYSKYYVDVESAMENKVIDYT